MTSYVNFMGEPVALDPTKHAKVKPKKEDKAGYHNGWRVQGIPPGTLEEARAEFRRQEKPWDEERWLMNAKRMAVRSKPYEVPEAAQQCRAMAEKAGWLRLEIVELKKEAA